MRGAPLIACLSALSTVASELNPNKILCPVLAAMHKGGDLPTDEFGITTLTAMYKGLHEGIGGDAGVAGFQAFGISNYDAANKYSQLSRDRCLPGFTFSGAQCFFKRKMGWLSEGTERYLNIFKMNGLQTVEHGMSTGTRGGANNVPDLESCGGVFPCEERFERFYVRNADQNGRLYHENILKMVCQARKEGDRSGEYSYASGLAPIPGLPTAGNVPPREWQMKAALWAMVDAFGHKDEQGKPYLTVQDARAMLMEGRYPDGWQKRDWGCLISREGCPYGLTDIISADVPCDLGENDAWWQESSCQVSTGATCKLWCDGGATCVNGQCMCARGKNGLGMCAEDGVCVERSAAECRYFGEACAPPILADNPSAMGNYVEDSGMDVQTVAV